MDEPQVVNVFLETGYLGVKGSALGGAPAAPHDPNEPPDAEAVAEQDAPTTDGEQEI